MFRRKKVGAEYYVERGEECLKSGNYPWAAESFSKALEFEPGLEAAYYGRAEAYMSLGREREAVWDYVRALEFDRRGPGDVQDALGLLKESVGMARVYMQRDKAKSAILAFGVPRILDEMIAAYDPRQEYRDTHFYDLALSWLREEAGGHHYYMGFVQLLRKRYDEAVKELDAAIGTYPENPDQYYLMGIALMKRPVAGDTARRFFEQSLAKGFKGRICPGCGYRTSSAMNFCLRCGQRMLR